MERGSWDIRWSLNWPPPNNKYRQVGTRRYFQGPRCWSTTAYGTDFAGPMWKGADCGLMVPENM